MAPQVVGHCGVLILAGACISLNGELVDEAPIGAVGGAFSAG